MAIAENFSKAKVNNTGQEDKNSAKLRLLPKTLAKVNNTGEEDNRSPCKTIYQYLKLGNVQHLLVLSTST
jgi:hypothetical protein